LRARQRTGTVRVGVAGGKGPLRWVAEDARRLQTGRISSLQQGALSRYPRNELEALSDALLAM
jgi:hypothetical protein